jgi:hypothetical protein
MSTLDDLRAQIAAMPGATTALFGAFSTPAIVDFDGQAWGPDAMAQVGVEIITMTYCFPDLPGLLPGSAITAGVDSFVVSRGPRRHGDGLEAVVVLENA